MNRHDLIDYRNNLEYLDKKFNDIMVRRERLYKITPTYEESAHSSSAIQDKFAQELAKIIDEETDYLKEVKQKMLYLREVENTLNQLENKMYRNILYYLYISEKRYNLTQVANMIDREYKHTCKLHGEALNEFDKICENRD